MSRFRNVFIFLIKQNLISSAFYCNEKKNGSSNLLLAVLNFQKMMLKLKEITFRQVEGWFVSFHEDFVVNAIYCRHSTNYIRTCTDYLSFYVSLFHFRFSFPIFFFFFLLFLLFGSLVKKLVLAFRGRESFTLVTGFESLC